MNPKHKKHEGNYSEVSEIKLLKTDGKEQHTTLKLNWVDFRTIAVY